MAHTDAQPPGPDRPPPSPGVSADAATAPPDLRAFVQAVAEVLAVQRDPWQMRPRMTALAFRCLLDRVGVYRSPFRPRLRSLRILRPAPAAVEVCAVVVCGRRTRALALRLDRAGPCWLCSHVSAA